MMALYNTSLGASFGTTENVSSDVIKDGGEQEADDAYRTFSYVISVIVMGALSVVGLVCNVLAFMTLQLDKRKLPMTILLQGLAVSDALFLVYTIIYSTIRVGLARTEHASDYKHFSHCVIAYVLPFGWITQTTSIWIVVLVTVDRYLAVVHPFRAEKLCTVRRARYALVVVAVLGLAFNMPRFFYYHHVAFHAGSTEGHDLGQDTLVGHVDVTNAAWKDYRNIYHVGLTITLLFAVPLPALIALNVNLIREISRARHRQQSLDRTKKVRDNFKVTLNLVIVVSVFIVCESPDFIASILMVGSIEERLYPTFMDYFLTVKELLLVISSATNFIIYCLFYEKFRRLLFALLCPTRAKKERLFTESEIPLRAISVKLEVAIASC